MTAAMLDVLIFPWAPPGERRQAQITADRGKRRRVNWGDVYRNDPRPDRGHPR